MKKKVISNGKLIFLIVFSLITIIVLYSRFISTKGLIVKEYPVYNTKITEDFDGLKIVHFSDLLFGRTVNKNDIKNIVNRINELKPDIVVFTGNLIDKDTIVNEKLTKYISNSLNKIDARLGKLAVYGTQDYRLDDYEIIMKNAGFNILNNSHDLVYYNSNIPILIAGFPASSKKEFDFNTTLEEHIEDNYYKIILIHKGDDFSKLKDYETDLVLCGHSLNGQIRIPFVGPLYTFEGSKKYYDNYYRINNTDLFVSSGIGTTNYSFRWFNKPSINLYRLYKK